jgi:phosphoribosylformylglycinamidine (FGAM) synthase-like enzyme
MTPEKRTERLREIMAQHKLSAADVGEILDRQAQTVRSWSSKYVHRAIPQHALTALEVELKKRAKREQAKARRAKGAE